MSHCIGCKTNFDITVTGVRSHYKTAHMPFTSTNGKIINDIAEWNKARNQQRNWETINQIISLRSLPYDISNPVKHNDHWEFDFYVDSIESFATNDNDVGALISDSNGVPMILDLDETTKLPPLLKPTGSDANIWFWIKS